MDNLRLMLIIIGSLAIVAVLAHGLLMSRKERSSIFNIYQDNKKKRVHSQASDERLDDECDDNPIKEWDSYSRSLPQAAAPVSDAITPSGPVNVPIKNKKEPRFSVTDTDENVPSTPVIDAKMKRVPASEKPRSTPTFEGNSGSITAPAEHRTVVYHTMKPSPIIRTHPVAVQSARPTPQDNPQYVIEEEGEIASVEPKKMISDVLVLHVTGMYDELIRGDILLSSILNEGFSFGEMQIFHRYAPSAIKRDALFSLANMVKPGYLNPQTMPGQMFAGISIFMMIPVEGDMIQYFKYMLQAAQRIANDVGGVVLDDQHSMLTPQRIRDYQQRIRVVIGRNTDS